MAWLLGGWWKSCLERSQALQAERPPLRCPCIRIQDISQCSHFSQDGQACVSLLRRHELITSSAGDEQHIYTFLPRSAKQGGQSGPCLSAHSRRLEIPRWEAMDFRTFMDQRAKSSTNGRPHRRHSRGSFGISVRDSGSKNFQAPQPMQQTCQRKPRRKRAYTMQAQRDSRVVCSPGVGFGVQIQGALFQT